MTGRPAVAVTGLGVRCAAGSTPDELWDSLLHGRSAVSLHSFDADGTVVHPASAMHGFDAAGARTVRCSSRCARPWTP